MVVQLIGFAGLFAGIIAFQSNKHKNILLIKTLSELLFALQFLLLGAYTGLVMNCIGIIRNLTLTKSFKSKKISVALVFMFSALIAAAGMITWQGPISLLALFGKLCTTVSYAIKKPKYLRMATLPSCLSWMVYDIFTLSYAGVIHELLGILSIFVAYLRFDRRKAEKPALKPQKAQAVAK